jgi:nucleotide-binding universal stress UspA family protein
MWALQDMATTLDAYIEVLTLFDEDKSIAFAPKDVEVRRKSNLETLLAPTRHGYSFENETMVKEGILYEALRSSADVVAMIPHHHSFLSSLFNQSETQRIAASITLPLLVLGEKVQLTAYDEADTVS